MLDFRRICLKIQLDCFFDVFESILFSVPFADAAGERWNLCRESALFLRLEDDFDLHENCFLAETCFLLRNLFFETEDFFVKPVAINPIQAS